MHLTHRNRFSQFTSYLGEFRSAAVPPLQRRGLFFAALFGKLAKRMRNISPLRRRGGTAAENI